MTEPPEVDGGSTPQDRRSDVRVARILMVVAPFALIVLLYALERLIRGD